MVAVNCAPVRNKCHANTTASNTLRSKTVNEKYLLAASQHMNAHGSELEPAIRLEQFADFQGIRRLPCLAVPILLGDMACDSQCLISFPCCF